MIFFIRLIVIIELKNWILLLLFLNEIWTIYYMRLVIFYISNWYLLPVY